ncbi:DUF4065 domain-containing protein [Rhodococcus fascians]|uniref:Panacea domain-containing protein n=1 Tax=Rhodococcus sp. IEGM1428 TaxID=3392191 RepID=UPI001D6D4CDA|nr:DUF4065 domain-containing protein [Rhodococcus fascians]MBY4058966.1 DUF4065 domain-containing protein [Rhodococcus fascians]MBY4067818.1 DUF4065 domain-containing protein [Rhodococcus fascians]
MASVQDVAAYILGKRAEMTAMKLQKLVYYSKAWHLVWTDESLFPERIEAWANGPVAPELYRKHRTMFMVRDGDIKGNAQALSEDERASIDAVLAHYGDMKAAQLSDLTHREMPWRDARGDVPVGAFCQTEITEAAMAEFYQSLLNQ